MPHDPSTTLLAALLCQLEGGKVTYSGLPGALCSKRAEYLWGKHVDTTEELAMLYCAADHWLNQGGSESREIWARTPEKVRERAMTVACHLFFPVWPWRSPSAASGDSTKLSEIASLLRELITEIRAGRIEGARTHRSVAVV